jgi:membrane protease YdiL (CAAX protease family)
MSDDSSSKPQQEHILLRMYSAVTTFVIGLVLYIVPPTLAVTLLWFGITAVGIMSTSQAQNWFETSAIAQFMYVLITEIIVILAIVGLLKLTRKTWHSIGLRTPRWSDIQYVIMGLFVYYIAYIITVIVVRQIAPLDFEQKQEIGFDTTTTGIGIAFAFLALVVLPPVVEEILFRGFLYTRFKQVLPKVAAAIAVSVLFGAAHLQFGSGNALLWVAALDTFILSLVLVYIREKTGTIWAGVGVHALKNLVAFLILFNVVQ